MGYGVYFVSDTERWQGYAVPGVCDDPDCSNLIDYGLGYKCAVDEDCWLCFCDDRAALRFNHKKHRKIDPKPNTHEWDSWMLMSDSWRQWRDENPSQVFNLQARTPNYAELYETLDDWKD